MKFGKQILAEQVPGWSQYYLDYKYLKKIISSLAAHRPASEAAALGLGVIPPAPLSTRDVFATPPTVTGDLPILATLGQDDDRGPDFQAHKTTFFFRLERELEKINGFYLEKEAELKLRLETLLSKRRAAAMHVLPDSLDENPTQDHVEWNAVAEGFRLLERDLSKLQQFVDINATGFRKILKKWDKRSKSSTKELYLARQVEVQPVFNRQLITELSDTVTACLLDLTDLSVGLKYEGRAADNPLLSEQLQTDRSRQMGPFRDLESSLRKAVAENDKTSLRDLVRYSDSLSQSAEAKMHVTRILWKTVIDAPQELADLILASTAGPFNYSFVDDINGRTCLHEVAITGVLRLTNVCLQNGVQKEKVDIYGRSALHYAAMYGHAHISHRLIEVGLPPNTVDVDNCTPLIYATLRGSVDCVRVLLEEANVSAETADQDGDLMPLSLAAQAGHLDVVLLLLQHNAPSRPNTNGEYPIHLAAQEGHAEIVRQLVNKEGWDTPDKYNEWTPVFHAARYGHEDSLRVLLQVGSRTDVKDEIGNFAVYYAAWYGHIACVSLLMEAISRSSVGSGPAPHASPMSIMSLGTDSDIDAIPSLSLPPPMMPYRVYGHNYLDRNSLVQVSVGHLSSKFGEKVAEPSAAVRLRPPFGGSDFPDRYLHSTPRLKLVMTPASVATAAPYSIPIPPVDEKTVFTFQVPTVEALSLEFSLYPNFGTKTMGRATALPSLFSDIQNSEPLVLPILDHRLHVIGEVSFEVNVIKPFSGVTLEIGGAVETYWKSIANQVSVSNTPPTSASTSRNHPTLTPKSQQFPRSMVVASAQNSPSTFPVHPGGSHSLTHSSVTGNFIRVTVQVTRDHQPVIFPEWTLPEEGYDLCVADVTLQQFLALAERRGRTLQDITLDSSSYSSLHDLHDRIAQSMTSLSELLKVFPPTLGICLEIAYAPKRIRERRSMRHHLDLNDTVDAVLRTIYATTTSTSTSTSTSSASSTTTASTVEPFASGHASRRNVIFTSFSPDVCSALNWKQPNYPVFFASLCGRTDIPPPSSTALTVKDAHDYRLSSLGAAVEWCKMNNLLGLLLDANLLHQIPSLIQGVKDFGLLVGAFGGQDNVSVVSGYDSIAIDAFLQDGVLTYFDHTKRPS